MKKYLAYGFLIASCITSSYTIAGGTLSDNLRIKSEILGYDLQYRVYVPVSVQPDDELPTLYITDGQWYISRGELPELMDREIANGNIEPAIVVFLDSRDPDKLSDNRRNRQFFCLKGYADFFTSELVTEIDANYPTRANRQDRVILGLSFGGYNSGCFGLMANETFAGIAQEELNQLTGGSDGDNEVLLIPAGSNVVVLLTITGVTQADVNKDVFVVDDASVALVDVPTNDVRVGKIFAVTENTNEALILLN